ncbi:unnamed protein product [Paramecium octaurelia]|uniref:Uncharacterized protein n=1 Tax=Paramecium octaurelia TaxID=43137 RepID=A0A8S1Y6G1_PAROT|nr:unnamed protein product [Paramecium octaurelia]CAD8207298.1 unnamed protein product [Paramecium octaurelia]
MQSIIKSSIKNNPITGNTVCKINNRGKRTFTTHDHIQSSCIVKGTPLNKTPNRHKIPDHSNEHFYPQNNSSSNINLRKSLSTFQPKENMKDPLSRKISDIYGQEIKITRSPIKQQQQSETISPQKRRILDNKSSHVDQNDVYEVNLNYNKEKSLPSDVDWFYVDTIKHRHDYRIEQPNPNRSSYKDQRSVLDLHNNNIPKNNYYQKQNEKLSKKQEVALQYTYLRAVKRSELVIKKK